MKRNLWALVVVLLAVMVGTAFALVRNTGFVEEAAATSNVVRNYDGRAYNLTIYTESADVEVIFRPYAATDDTTKVLAGTSFTWTDRQHEGFTIIRATSTKVVAWWW